MATKSKLLRSSVAKGYIATKAPSKITIKELLKWNDDHSHAQSIVSMSPDIEEKYSDNTLRLVRNDTPTKRKLLKGQVYEKKYKLTKVKLTEETIPQLRDTVYSLMSSERSHLEMDNGERGRGYQMKASLLYESSRGNKASSSFNESDTKQDIYNKLLAKASQHNDEEEDYCYKVDELVIIVGTIPFRGGCAPNKKPLVKKLYNLKEGYSETPPKKNRNDYIHMISPAL